MRTYYTYILASFSRVLYVGVTNDPERRVYQHRTKQRGGFTAQYSVNQLVWYESFRDIRDAIAAEKRIKGWTRAKKVALIEEGNPHWEDINAGWPAPDRP